MACCIGSISIIVFNAITIALNVLIIGLKLRYDVRVGDIALMILLAEDRAEDTLDVVAGDAAGA